MLYENALKSLKIDAIRNKLMDENDTKKSIE